MPAQKATSGLFQKLGTAGQKAVAGHRADETVVSTAGELPAGIEGGIAQLTKCRFQKIKPGKQNAGQYILYAEAVVISPATHNGAHVKGMHTRVTENMFETPQSQGRKTVDEHVAWVLNFFRTLGADTSDATLENLEEIAATIEQMEPRIKFRTWKPEKQTTGPYAGKEPRTFHQWQGALTDSENEAVEPQATNGEVVDESGDVEVADEVQDDSGEAVEDDSDAVAEDELDLDQLAAEASSKNQDAAKQLLDLAESLGIRSEVKDAATWAEGVELIRQAQGGGEPVEEESSGEPAVGENVYYKPVDPKTKKPATKKVAAEIIVVNKKSETVDLKSMDGKKTVWKGVKWTDLITA